MQTTLKQRKPMTEILKPVLATGAIKTKELSVWDQDELATSSTLSEEEAMTSISEIWLSRTS